MQQKGTLERLVKSTMMRVTGTNLRYIEDSADEYRAEVQEIRQARTITVLFRYLGAALLNGT